MTHIAETQDEVRIVREKYGMTPVEHLDALGMLDARTIGAHCIHLTDTDIATLAARSVAVSHNPQSNMKISSGVAPVERLRAAGCAGDHRHRRHLLQQRPRHVRGGAPRRLSCRNPPRATPSRSRPMKR